MMNDWVTHYSNETDQIVTEGKSVFCQHFDDVWLAAICLVSKPGTPHVLRKVDIRTNITSVNNPNWRKSRSKKQDTLQTSSSPLVFSPRLGTLMVSSRLMAPRLISRMNWDSCGCRCTLIQPLWHIVTEQSDARSAVPVPHWWSASCSPWWSRFR